ncbi:MAG: OmpA/MotB domain protein [Magnetococcales bacterium]|nr:OmpA/MotB domain protein [Magnetococcales bacterium]HIJ82595.1 peptidoglycan-associated lipoprotein Pal [Magnetococcales bacterium]
MKRLASFFITVLLLGTLAGCGAVPNEGPDGAAAQGGGAKSDGAGVGGAGGYGSNLDDPNAAGALTEADRRVHFDFNSAALTPQAESVLAKNARALSRSAGRVQVEGHCDERGTREYNLALGQKRADAAAQFLISQGVDSGRIKTISYGKERPMIQGHDETSWQQNRRAEIIPQ